jgi:hypothetical protein
MASRWSQYPRPNSRASHDVGSAPDSPRPGAAASGRSRQEYISTPPPWSEPPPLDDNCAKYILSVMVMFLRQTSPDGPPLLPANRGMDANFRDFENHIGFPKKEEEPQSQSRSNISTPDPVVQPELRPRPSSTSITSTTMSVGGISIASVIPIKSGNTVYEKTHISQIQSQYALHELIAKFAGRIIFHISATNWKVVFYRLRTKIHFLASQSDETPDTIDLQVLGYCVLDRSRLTQILTGMS